MGPEPRKRATGRPSIENVKIDPDERVRLYSLSKRLTKGLREECGLTLTIDTYFQDPFETAAYVPEQFKVLWEPGLQSGPTSSRFAVVDFDADTGLLEEPSKWSLETFETTGGTLDNNNQRTLQFHQVSVWANLQRALDYFEGPVALGRPISWGFEGNRLIVVPHAGNGENAFYDRQSKSLQFYYFEDSERDRTVYTCLSSDIVNHEFSHAVLDGVRPFFNESASVETGAFHEFTGDITAILLTIRNSELRKRMAKKTGGDISKADDLIYIATEFGEATQNLPYLRTATNDKKMKDFVGSRSVHDMSQVLTGAMFDIFKAVCKSYIAKQKTSAQAFNFVSERMQRMVIQPLDFLPPVEVTFNDYARAVCRVQRLADPVDPNGYFGMCLEAFVDRGIFTQEEADKLEAESKDYLVSRMELEVTHSIGDIARSRAGAYRFLDDNRQQLLIPALRDFFVADLYDSRKTIRQGLTQPRQITLEYIWREEVQLDGERFGAYNGQTTTMLCGGTLVFDEAGNILYWAMKPGSEPYAGVWERGGKLAESWTKAISGGAARKQALLDELARRIASGEVGDNITAEKGLLANKLPPMSADTGSDGLVRFQLTPHLHLSRPHQLEDELAEGGRQWEILS